jgi:hypothetical protein
VSCRREEEEFVSTFMHCTDVGMIRDIAKGIAIQLTQMGEVARVSEVISVDGRMVLQFKR